MHDPSSPIRSLAWAMVLLPLGGCLSAPSAPQAATSPGIPAAPSAEWSLPVTVATEGYNEPWITTAPDGALYYSPTRSLYRSDDQGATWKKIDPGIPTAMPWVVGSDSGVSIAPDGTVWWTRFWPFLGPTLACRSTNRGESWNCDNLAIVGATDRMWILGRSANEAYVVANHAFAAYEWRRTTNGGTFFEPHGFLQASGFIGNMVIDASTHEIYQVMHQGGRQTLLRVDNPANRMVAPPRDTKVPHSFSLGGLALADGVLWLAGEPGRSDGSRGLVAARSRDHGATWEQIEVPTSAESVTFATIAAAPDGRIALAYYGSDKRASPDGNGGTWSVYVSETWNGLDEEPVWTTTGVVERIHVGSICAGVACAEQGDDASARYAGDFMGVHLDADGHVLVGYVADVDGGRMAMFVRQTSTA